MKNFCMGIIVLVVLVLGCRQANGIKEEKENDMHSKPIQTDSAVFAGGCFWCTESDFEKVDGVIEVISGYTGGEVVNPSYEEVSKGGTGHVEAVKVVYDPTKITFEKLLNIFWRHVDPTDEGGQFVDRGMQYRSVIFYGHDEERRLAEASKKRLGEAGLFQKPIVTDILPLGPFYPAEDYHQDYYKKNPIRYRWYRHGSGRDQFLEKTWEGRELEMTPNSRQPGPGDMPTQGNNRVKETAMPNSAHHENMPRDISSEKNASGPYNRPDDKTLRTRLTDLQYEVTQRNGTEPPFKNAYWDNHEAGIYVDIVTGEPLFSSTDKFDSGTGWPSFSRTLEPGNIVEKSDRSFFMVRTEVRSKYADSHLGHLFNDGPKPTGLRYCINSAALRFVPAADLERAGYGKYRKLFE